MAQVYHTSHRLEKIALGASAGSREGQCPILLAKGRSLRKQGRESGLLRPPQECLRQELAPSGSVWIITNALNVVDKPRLCYNSIGFVSSVLFRPLGS